MSKIDRLRQRLAVTGMPDDFDEREENLNTYYNLPDDIGYNRRVKREVGKRKPITMADQKRYKFEKHLYNEPMSVLDRETPAEKMRIHAENPITHDDTLKALDEVINEIKNRTPEQRAEWNEDAEWKRDSGNTSEEFKKDNPTHQPLTDSEYKKKYGPIDRRTPPSFRKKERKLGRRGLMTGKLKQRIAQVRLAADYSMQGWGSFGPDLDVISRFQKKEKFQKQKGKIDKKTGTKKGDWKFRSDGNTLFVWDNPVAKHTKDGGYDASAAGYNTPLTMSTLNALGIPAREGRYDPEGKNRISLGSKFLKSNDPSWVHIPRDEVQGKPIIYDDRGKGAGRETGTRRHRGRSTGDQSKFHDKTVSRELKEQNMESGLPFSKTNIQPKQQDQINKITGLNTPRPFATRGNKAHHLLDYKGVGKHLPEDYGGIMLPDDYHDFITQFEKGSPEGNQERLRQVSSKLRLKIARIRQRNISRKVTQINMARDDSDPDRAWLEASGQLEKLVDTPGYEGNFTLHKGKLVNFEHEKDTLDLLDSVEGDQNYSMFSVSNTHDIVDRKDPQLKTKFNEFVKQGFKPTIGKWEGKFDATVNFRDKDRKQVENIARGKLNDFGKPIRAQQSYVETTEIPRKAPTGPRKFKTKFFNYNEETDTYEE